MTSKLLIYSAIASFCISILSITNGLAQHKTPNVNPATDKHWALTVFGGTSNYFGDLTSKASPFSVNSALTSGSFGFGYEKRFSHRFVLRGEFSWARIKGDDAQTASIGSFEYDRNLSFRNDIYQLSALAQFDLIPHYGHYSERKRFTPYLLTGLTTFLHTPKGKTTAEYGSTWVDLSSLGTEGQGNENTRKKYNKVGIAVPFGLGVNIKVTDRMDVGLEWITRFTFTDYLDDVSKNYAGDASFGNNQLAAAMADRSQESSAVLTGQPRQVPTYKFGPGDKRGSNNKRDGYSNFLIKVRYILSKNEAPNKLSWLHKNSEQYNTIGVHSDKLANSTRDISEFDKYKSRYTIQNLAINTEGSERSPNFYHDGLIYATDRNDRKHFNKATRKSYYNFYYAPLADLYKNEQTRPVNIENDDLKKYHHHSAYQINDTQIITTLYSSDLPSQKVAQHKLFLIDILGENIWAEAIELPFNNEHYSISEPTISKDGTTMYFVSDMKGGYGGTDIYVSYRYKEQWTYPINLGGIVNTSGDEVSPFLHDDGTLYFASNGHKGMGGLDLFETIAKDDKIFAVTNLGSPINSPYDDFGLLLNKVKRIGYFTSNRVGGKGGNDIYQLNVNEINVSRMLTDEHENLFVVEEMKLKGKVISKDTRTALPKILVSLKNTETNALITKRTDKNGVFEFDVSNESNYEIFPSAFGYKRMKPTKISTVGVFGVDEITKTLLIAPLAKKVKLYGQVTNKQTGELLKNIELVFISPNEDENIYVKSDGEGNYSMEINKDKKYFFFVEEDGFLQKNYAIPDLSKFRSVSSMKYNIRLAPKE
ncbi:hypothetical protein EI427_15195 [Flammeovirga pectinis]|uniref:DUF6089 domain-containing protein n=1 Tax=Flammeovirga pectinis TaxID=2494373 RepID=A0A3Q9FPP6_9BACT|nr:DUF6089 family protein [Flammeovirga pectinis]AZQ63519.1 hypothetical protein EI427_15195 [Flammeovirga pectinis]